MHKNSYGLRVWTWFEKHAFYVFVFLALLVTFYGYFYPLLKNPYDASNPWPDAYQVIQKEIISQQKVPPDYVIQFGEKQPSDMTYFLNHHLMMVEMKLTDGLPFDINERFVSAFFTFLIFLSAYLCFTKIFGNKSGFWASMLFLFLPRNLNYYVNVNGEFFSFLLLFVSLYFLFDWIQERNRKSLVVGIIIAAIMPILCLINFGTFCIVIFSYGMMQFLYSKQKPDVVMEYLKLFGLIVAASFIISGIPLIITGNLFAGESSSIGSLYSQRDQKEVKFEKKYYEDYATYGRTLYGYPALVRDLYYMSLDGSQINYLFVYFVFPALLGALLIINKKTRSRELVFSLCLAVVLLALEVFLYSRLFNDNIYNSALRFLLYFGLPMAFIGGIALDYLRRHWAYLGLIFLISISVSGFFMIKYSAHSGNLYLALYAKSYKQALAWVKDNTLPDDKLISNEWTGGQFWVQADRLDLVESGKASAAYSTYTKIYSNLDAARKIFSLDVPSEETAALINQYDIKYIVIWNRPASYLLYPFEASKRKLDQLPYVERVFDATSLSDDSYRAEAAVYRVKTSQLPQWVK